MKFKNKFEISKPMTINTRKENKDLFVIDISDIINFKDIIICLFFVSDDILKLTLRCWTQQ